MIVPFVDLNAQYLKIKKDIDGAIKKVLDHSSFVGGSIVTDFEQAFAHYIGLDHCVGCGNGTDAIEIILKALGVGEGDEVIVPACSWISTSEAITTVGAKPVFADVLPNLYTIDPNDIVRKISPKTKGIIPVHLYGLPAEMDEIMEIASAYKLFVLEDCAQAHNARYKGKKVGTFGIASTFSFYPGKNLGAYGDAGAMLTNDTDLADKCRMIGNHGQQGKHNHLEEGRNSRLDTLQAAILSAKLPYLDQWSEERFSRALVYNQHLIHNDIMIPIVPDYSKHVFHLYVIQVKQRERIMEALKKKDIQTAIHYPTPLPFLKAYHYLHHVPEDFPVAAQQMDNILSLPMFPELTDEQISYVCNVVLENC